ncbi:MAG: polyribonucleotide nucleotidyltransferase [Desulfovibrionaceae bacterium]
MKTDIFGAERIKTLVGGKEYIFEAASMANQADGAIWIQCGDTVVLVTVCVQKNSKPCGFLPLTVEYSERMYAIGRIPGSFFRREIGRPSEQETLISRLIDRPIRPFFPKGFENEIQIIATVLSSDQENDADVLAITGASAVLMISSAPFESAIAGGRIARINGELFLNPDHSLLEKADINIILAASHDAIVMVEGSANFVPEHDILEALKWGHSQLLPLINSQIELQKLVGKEKIPFIPQEQDPALLQALTPIAIEILPAVLQIPEKMSRKKEKKIAKELILQRFYDMHPMYAEKEEYLPEIHEILDSLEKTIVRKRIKEHGLRIDGRDTKTVRPITIATGILPRAHGSALFARGETKSLVVTTLGSGHDEQKMDSILGESSKNFMLHYNFPPFSVGEVKPVRVSRREIGHGALAERAIKPTLPNTDTFPYTIRIVSETLESNGSSSMAAICGGILSLMDAGVPIKTPVAGIAMGLIKEGDQYIILTDILGDEDALGDMDFKVAGNRDGITAIQMDIKIMGLPQEILELAMLQAKEARLVVMDAMIKTLSEHRAELSQYAPQFEIFSVQEDSIRAIIGPSGKNVKHIIAETGVNIDIEDSGRITIFAPSKEAMSKAKNMILLHDQRAELGKNYVAIVKKILEVGAIVEIAPSLEALLHISQISKERINKVEDILNIGQSIEVKVIEVFKDKIRASHKAIILEKEGIEWLPESTTQNKRYKK